MNVSALGNLATNLKKIGLFDEIEIREKVIPEGTGVELARNSYPQLRSFKHLKTIALLDALKNGIGLFLNMRALRRTRVSKV